MRFITEIKLTNRHCVFIFNTFMGYVLIALILCHIYLGITSIRNFLQRFPQKHIPNQMSRCEQLSSKEYSQVFICLGFVCIGITLFLVLLPLIQHVVIVVHLLLLP